MDSLNDFYSLMSRMDQDNWETAPNYLGDLINVAEDLATALETAQSQAYADTQELEYLRSVFQKIPASLVEMANEKASG